MHPNTFARLLHRYVPEWDESIRHSRDELDFRFEMGPGEQWQWLMEGRYLQVTDQSSQVIEAMQLLDDLSGYWVSCFFSDYLRPDGYKDLEEIKGPPYLDVSCPSDSLGEQWNDSLRRGAASVPNVEGPWGPWQRSETDVSALLELARAEVEGLGLPVAYTPQWVCCMLAAGLKREGRWFASSGGWLRGPDDWDAFTCPYRPPRRRVRAYPTGIDWGEPPSTEDDALRSDRRTTGWESSLRGIRFRTETGVRSRPKLTISWDPTLVGVADLREAVGYFQREYGIPMKADADDRLTRLIRDRLHAAKQRPNPTAATLSARLSSGESTVEDFLVEEALGESAQDAWRQILRNTTRGQNRETRRRRLIKTVYDRVRKRVKAVGYDTSLVRRSPPWFDGLFLES